MTREIWRAVVLTGPRSVGKTVMLYHLVQELIEYGVKPKKIIFIIIENLFRIIYPSSNSLTFQSKLPA